MIEFIKNLFNGDEDSSSTVAKDRLKFVLVHDRTNCSEGLLEDMRKDIIDVISKYMDIDQDALKIEMSESKSEDGTKKVVPVLYANIPIKKVKKEKDRVEK